MKFFLGLVSFLGLIGCGATVVGVDKINARDGHIFQQYSKDRSGDQDRVRIIDTDGTLRDVLGGGFGGVGLGSDSYAPAQTPIYMSGPVVSDGARAMETYPSGPVILETGVASMNGSGPASGPAASSAAGGYVTKAQGAVMVRKDQQQDRRLDALEQTVHPNQ